MKTPGEFYPFSLLNSIALVLLTLKECPIYIDHKEAMSSLPLFLPYHKIDLIVSLPALSPQIAMTCGCISTQKPATKCVNRHFCRPHIWWWCHRR